VVGISQILINREQIMKDIVFVPPGFELGDVDWSFVDSLEVFDEEVMELLEHIIAIIIVLKCLVVLEGVHDINPDALHRLVQLSDDMKRINTDDRFWNHGLDRRSIRLIHVHNHVFDVLDLISVQCTKIVAAIVLMSRGNDINDLVCFEIKKDTCILVGGDPSCVNLIDAHGVWQRQSFALDVMIKEIRDLLDGDIELGCDMSEGMIVVSKSMQDFHLCVCRN